MPLLVLLLRSLKLSHKTATGVPLHGPTDVQWMGDHDGRQKWVGGIVQFERAQSEESITHYNASWFTEAVDLGVVCGGEWICCFGTWYSPPKNPFIEDIISLNIYNNVTSCLLKQSGFRIRGRLCDQITKPNSTFLEKSAIWRFEKKIKFMQISLAAPTNLPPFWESITWCFLEILRFFV